MWTCWFCTREVQNRQQQLRRRQHQWLGGHIISSSENITSLLGYLSQSSVVSANLFLRPSSRRLYLRCRALHLVRALMCTECNPARLFNQAGKTKRANFPARCRYRNCSSTTSPHRSRSISGCPAGLHIMAAATTTAAVSPAVIIIEDNLVFLCKFYSWFNLGELLSKDRRDQRTRGWRWLCKSLLRLALLLLPDVLFSVSANWQWLTGIGVAHTATASAAQLALKLHHHPVFTATANSVNEIEIFSWSAINFNSWQKRPTEC